MPNVRRGEVWQVDFGLAAKVRPALVLGCDIADEDRVLIAVVYHTTALRGSRYEVPMRVPGLDEGGFDAQSLYTVPAVKLIRRRTVLTPLRTRARRTFSAMPRSTSQTSPRFGMLFLLIKHGEGDAGAAGNVLVRQRLAVEFDGRNAPLQFPPQHLFFRGREHFKLFQNGFSLRAHVPNHNRAAEK